MTTNGENVDDERENMDDERENMGDEPENSKGGNLHAPTKMVIEAH